MAKKLFHTNFIHDMETAQIAQVGKHCCSRA